MSLVNVVLAQGGGPTSVINASLAAAIREYQRYVGDKIGKIYVAINGTDGLLNEELVEVTNMSEHDLGGLEQTICAAAGTSRVKLDTDHKRERIIEVLGAHNINIVNLIGGGDTASTVAEINKVAEKQKYNLVCMHILKTVDNDGYGLFSPGWGTTGLWQRNAVLSLIKEVDSAPGAILTSSMGRDSGWITAMTTHAFFAENKDRRYMQRIYTPETGFTLDRFVSESCETFSYTKGKLIINVSEGVQEDGCKISLHERLANEAAADSDLITRILKDAQISQAAKALIKNDTEFARLLQRHTGASANGTAVDEHTNPSYGDIRGVNLADWLAGYLENGMKDRLGLPKLKIRAITFGHVQRCPIDIAYLDWYGARLEGQKAASTTVEFIVGGGGNSSIQRMYGGSVVLNSGDIAHPRLISKSMQAEVVTLDKMTNLATGKGIQYKMPPEFMTRDGPTQSFLEYSRPMIEGKVIRANPHRFIDFTLPSVSRAEKKCQMYAPEK
jgi:6-phosphofructokinase